MTGTLPFISITFTSTRSSMVSSDTRQIGCIRRFAAAWPTGFSRRAGPTAMPSTKKRANDHQSGRYPRLALPAECAALFRPTFTRRNPHRHSPRPSCRAVPLAGLHQHYREHDGYDPSAAMSNAGTTPPWHCAGPVPLCWRRPRAFVASRPTSSSRHCERRWQLTKPSAANKAVELAAEAA
jgi:hypothetical protein